jgi:hypothetical protein
MKLPARFRRPLRIAVWGFSIAGIVSSLVSLQPAFALPIGLLCLLLALVSERAVFQYPFFFFHAGWELLQSPNERLGVLWGIGEFDGDPVPTISLLFDTKKKAAFAYKALRTWTLGKYVDRHQDIRLTVVLEGNQRYSVFIYPGDRVLAAVVAHNQVAADLPPQSEPVPKLEARPYFFNPADYSTRPKMKILIESLHTYDRIFMNTAYLRADRPIAYAKRAVRLEAFKVISRADVLPSMLESLIQWHDVNEATPELVERLKSVKLNDA